MHKKAVVPEHASKISLFPARIVSDGLIYLYRRALIGKSLFLCRRRVPSSGVAFRRSITQNSAHVWPGGGNSWTYGSFNGGNEKDALEIDLFIIFFLLDCQKDKWQFICCGVYAFNKW